MVDPAPVHHTLDDWVRCDAIPFSIERPAEFHAAVDRMIAALGDGVELLGLGEALHGDESLGLRNRLFQRLVEAHGYRAIAVESSFPRGHAVNEYVLGGGPASFDEVRDVGFSHGFGRLEANRELVEWMRQYNADASHAVKLQFFGFDSPTEMTGTDSPRQVINFVLDYLASIDGVAIQARRERIETLLGQDADWENPAALMDPSKSIGLGPAAGELRIEIEDLATELRLRRPELTAKSDAGRYLEAEQYTSVARQFLNYHASLARPSSNRLVELLGIRDLMMADILARIVEREQVRCGGEQGGGAVGRVFAFAHNTHLQRGMARWQLGPSALAWWPAGAHLAEQLGPRYAAIGSAIGASAASGITPAEPGTLEAHLSADLEAARFIPTDRGQHLPPSALTNLKTRSSSTKNSTYFPLTAQSLTDFDWLVVLNSNA